MRISVKVKTKTSKEEVIKQEDGSYLVYLKAVREKGKANISLKKVLADFFNVAPSNITIFSGKKSKNKIIDIL